MSAYTLAVLSYSEAYYRSNALRTDNLSNRAIMFAVIFLLRITGLT